jgi:hypothetical protein
VFSVINAFVLAFVGVAAYMAFCFIMTLYVLATIALIVLSAFAGLCNDK